MSAGLEGDKFVDCGEFFVLSVVFESAATSGTNFSLAPSGRTERAVSSDCPPLPEAGSAITNGTAHSPKFATFDGAVSGVGRTASGPGCAEGAGIDRKTGAGTRRGSAHESAEGCLTLVKPDGSHSRAAASGPETGDGSTAEF